MSEEKSTTFRLKNNDLRGYQFAGRLCIAGTGNPTPPEAMKMNRMLPAAFFMTEEEMFRSYRGITSAMRTRTREGNQAIQVFLEGNIEMTAEDLEAFAKDIRKRNNWAEPKTRAEITAEVERAMNRPDDPVELAAKRAKTEEGERLATAVTKALAASIPQIIAALRAQETTKR